MIDHEISHEYQTIINEKWNTEKMTEDVRMRKTEKSDELNEENKKNVINKINRENNENIWNLKKDIFFNKYKNV